MIFIILFHLFPPPPHPTKCTYANLTPPPPATCRGPVPMTAALNLQLVLCSLAEMRPHSTVLHRALHLTYTCLDLNYALKKVIRWK